jgi:proline dehydrogenase
VIKYLHIRDETNDLSLTFGKKFSTLISYENTEVAFKSKTDKDLNRAHLLFSIMNNRIIVQIGKLLYQFAAFLHLPVKFMIKGTIFKHFCGGETMAESDTVINSLSHFNVKTILDYSVEGKEEEKDLDRSYEMILATVENAGKHKDIPYAVFKPTGMARFALLQKVNDKLELNAKEKEEFQRVVNRFDGICKKGFELNVPILIDAEESWIQNTIDDIVHAMMEKYNKDKCIVFNTAQLYRHDRLEFLRKSFDWARSKGLKYGIKLVRGAYLEKERERAIKYNYTDPTNPDKAATDRDFNASIKLCIDNIDIVEVCCGSHNEESNQYLATLMKEKGLPNDDKRIFAAQLLGMSDHISFNMSNVGYNVAKYVPFGPVFEVTPYLIRRTEENSSIAGQSSRELILINKERARRKLA